MKPPSCGLVLFAHGSADPDWKSSIISLANAVESKAGDVVVKPAYLKEMSPSIYEVVDGMAGDGVKRIIVVPLFLSGGAHSARDFPVIAKRLEEKHGRVEFEWTQVIGQWAEVQSSFAKAIETRLKAVKE